MREKHDMTETEWINWKILYHEKILKFISNYLSCSFKKKFRLPIVVLLLLVLLLILQIANIVFLLLFYSCKTPVGFVHQKFIYILICV